MVVVDSFVGAPPGLRRCLLLDERSPVGTRISKIPRFLLASIVVILTLPSVAPRVLADANETTRTAVDAPAQASVTAGGYHSCVVLTTGAVQCWGWNGHGQLGDNTTTERHIPTQVTGLTSGVTAITSGRDHTCALLTTGAVQCWGWNAHGQLGDNTTTERHIPTQVTGLTSGVTAVSAGTDHTCALLTTGAVQCWGWNAHGQLGDNTTRPKLAPTQVTDLTSGVTAISSARDHTCALLTTGAVQCWGLNAYGQLGDSSTISALTPVASGLTSGATAITAGNHHTCALLTTGAAQCWGGNSYGQLGDSTTAERVAPTQVTGLTSGVTVLAAGYEHTCALLSTGATKCWGWNSHSQLGDNTTANKNSPTQVTGLSSGVMAVTAGLGHSCALLLTGAAQCWGWNSHSQLGDNTTVVGAVDPVDVVGIDGVAATASALSVGHVHACAVLSDGTSQCWGSNAHGELGDGTVTRLSAVPVTVTASATTSLTNVSTTAAGYAHTCALLTTGAVQCWGWNNHGQLGDNTRTQRLAPVTVSGLTSGVIAIAAGNFHTCALLTTGAVQCWGWNNHGQLGDNTRTQRLAPMTVSGLTSGVTAIAAGNVHTCALLSDATMKCWGWNNHGQLGDNTRAQRLTPGAVHTSMSNGNALQSVAALAAGNFHTCALLSDATMKCWGWNGHGQLGDNTRTERLAPMAVSSLAGVAALAAGGHHTCAVLNTNTAKCWGLNAHGQLGDDTTTTRLTPVDVTTSAGASLDTVAVLGAGTEHTCAQLTTGAVKCWGYHSYGQLGNNTTPAGASTPTGVYGLSSGVGLAPTTTVPVPPPPVNQPVAPTTPDTTTPGTTTPPPHQTTPHQAPPHQTPPHQWRRSRCRPSMSSMRYPFPPI
jgi:alpha-tubulin suppressor-like RCC1 family protein